MTLKKCIECGSEISNDAKFCTHCGKPTNTAIAAVNTGATKSSMETSMETLAWVVVGVIVFGMYSCSGKDKSSSTPAFDSAATVAQNPRETPQAAAPAKSNTWFYDKNIEPISGKELRYASIVSDNANDLHRPYGPNITGTLMLRKHPRHGKDVIVSLTEGQILCRSYDPCSIMIRFDSRPAIRFTAAGPSDGSSESVFIRGYDKLLAEIKKSKLMTVELPMYQDGNQIWTFNVAGLDWPP